MERDYGPGIKRKRPHVLRDIALAACNRVSVVGLGAVPRKEVLITIDIEPRGTLAVESIDNIDITVSAMVKLKIPFSQSMGNVKS